MGDAEGWCALFQKAPRCRVNNQSNSAPSVVVVVLLGSSWRLRNTTLTNATFDSPYCHGRPARARGACMYDQRSAVCVFFTPLHPDATVLLCRNVYDRSQTFVGCLPIRQGLDVSELVRCQRAEGNPGGNKGYAWPHSGLLHRCP